MKEVIGVFMAWVLQEFNANLPKICVAVIEWRSRRILRKKLDEERIEAKEAVIADIMAEESRIMIVRLTYRYLRQTWKDDIPALGNKDDKTSK